MRFKFLLLFPVLILGVASYAQIKEDAILGDWMNTGSQNLIINVYKTNNEFAGKIKSSTDTVKKKPVGFLILEKLVYNPSSGKWEKGKIHNPDSGKTYNAIITVKNDSTMEVRGYMGMKILGKTKTFKRM